MFKNLTSKNVLRVTLQLGLIALTLSGLASTAFAGEIVDHTNRNNPWDHVGALHNEALDAMSESFSEVGSRNGVIALSMVQKLDDFAAAVTGAQCPSGAVEYDDIAVQISSSWDDSIVGARLNDEQRPYFEQMMDVAGRLHESPAETLAEMKALEQEILETLGEDDAAPLLVGAAVGRYSFAYWTEQFSTKGPWIGHVGGGDADFKIPNWLKADLKGAITGAVGGVGGGAGGILLGGLLGGAAASAIHAIENA